MTRFKQSEPTHERYLNKPSVQQPPKYKYLPTPEQKPKLLNLAKGGLCWFDGETALFYSKFDLEQWLKQ